MGIDGPPIDVIAGLAAELNIDAFVETGTYLGQTAEWAASRFRSVITIEASPELHAAVKQRLAPLKNVDCKLGNSRAALGPALRELGRPAILWLDAHWSAGRTYGEGDECPVLEEIATVEATGLDHVVIIDDARLFFQPPQPPHDPAQWPSIGSILGALERDGKRYAIVRDDAIIAVPARARAALIKLVVALGAAPRKSGFRRMLGRLKRSFGR